MARIEPDGTLGALGEQLQHPAGAGADIEHAAEWPLADHVEDHTLDRARSRVQRPFLVPDRGDPLEVLAGGIGAPAAHDVETFEVGGDHRIGRVDCIQRRREQREVSTAFDDPEERPRALAVFADEACVDEQPEVARHAAAATAPGSR